MNLEKLNTFLKEEKNRKFINNILLAIFLIIISLIVLNSKHTIHIFDHMVFTEVPIGCLSLNLGIFLLLILLVIIIGMICVNFNKKVPTNKEN